MTSSFLPINDGDRPSALDLDRRLMGELDGPVPDAHRAATDTAKAELPPLDIAALRHRANVSHRPVRRPRGWMFAGLGSIGILAAAALLFVPPEPASTRTKGAPQLGWMVLHDGVVDMGNADRTVEAGDHIQFTWAGTADTIVLIGIDGHGEPTVLWPESPDAPPVVLDPDSGLLQGSVRLDDAPGPERFFAVFDARSVPDATARVMDAFHHHHSRAALYDWADDTPDIDLVILDKSP